MIPDRNQSPLVDIDGLIHGLTRDYVRDFCGANVVKIRELFHSFRNIGHMHLYPVKVEMPKTLEELVEVKYAFTTIS